MSDTAEYVHTQLDGLAKMCREAGLDILAYLLEFAKLEAENQIKSHKRRS
jgi:hypothetical protein